MKLIVDIFYQQGDDPFLVNSIGGAVLHDLEEIEAQVVEDARQNSHPFESGDGTYRFTAEFVEPQRGDEGRIEIAGYWDLTQIDFEPVKKEQP